MGIHSNRKIYVGVVFHILTSVTFFEAYLGQSFPAFFIFGDSSIDPGNNNYIVTIARSNYEPNGIVFGVPTGRLTNGRTVVDIIGQELGFKDFTPPYLAPTTSGPVILQGVNYASAGAGIFNETGFIFGGRINLDAQIDNFANTRQEIISSIGLTPALELLNKALFTLAMGSNDFLCNYLLPVTGAAQRKLISPEEFVEILISKYGLQLTRLYNLGARKIVVSNVGPIGCAPSQRDVNVHSCVESSNQIAKLFNTQLKRLVSELTSLEGSNFVYADVYHIVENILGSYASYGFENVNSSCCHVDWRFRGFFPCVPLQEICLDRSKYFFWDRAHPTEAANVLIAKRFPSLDPLNCKLSLP